MNQPTKKSGALFELISHARVVFELIKHPRVHPLVKLIPILAAVYVIVPTDLIPIIPVLSAFDDIAILGAALTIFYVLVPAEVIEEINQRLYGVQSSSAKPEVEERIIDAVFVEMPDDKEPNS